jgi:hypothetical protein
LGSVIKADDGLSGGFQWVVRAKPSIKRSSTKKLYAKEENKQQMVDWKSILAVCFSVGLIVGGVVYLSASGASLYPIYLGTAVIVLSVAILAGKAVGAYNERTFLAPLTTFPGVLLVGVAELMVGDGGVVSVVIGSGIAGLFLLFVVLVTD